MIVFFFFTVLTLGGCLETPSSSPLNFERSKRPNSKTKVDQRVWPKAIFSQEVPKIHASFKIICLSCHRDRPLSIIFEEDYLRSAFQQAPRPLEVSLIKKLLPGTSHEGGELCYDPLEVECQQLMKSWLRVYDSNDRFSLKEFKQRKTKKPFQSQSEVYFIFESQDEREIIHFCQPNSACALPTDDFNLVFEVQDFKVIGYH